MNYICYLDLLGIKETAIGRTNKFFNAMDKFQTNIAKSLAIIKNDKNRADIDIQIYFFSDCFFAESKEFSILADFLIELRKTLIADDSLFYSAAIIEGELDALHSSKAANNMALFIKKNGLKKNITGTTFNNPIISKLYIIQSEYKGVGVFIEKKLIHNLKSNKDIVQKYISEAFYYPTFTGRNIIKYYDLKISNDEIDEEYFLDRIFRKYYESNCKSKKYGRYYQSILSNYIDSSRYENLEIIKDSNKKKLLSTPFILNFLVNRQKLINELINNAFNFEILYFYLLEHIYAAKKNSAITHYFVEEILHKIPKCKKYLSNLSLLPESIFDHSFKDYIITDNHTILLNNKKFK